jgi:hypothetical protein
MHFFYKYSLYNLALHIVNIAFNILSNECIVSLIASSDDDVYLEYYSAKGFHISYSCLHVLRKTHKLVE